MQVGEDRKALKYRITSAPATEPVTLAEVKAQLRFDESVTTMDNTITPLITAAREWCENYQNRAYITQSLELVLDDWPYDDDIRLPRPPLQTVSAVTYTDSTGTVSTMSSSSGYIVDTVSEPGFVVAKDCWPTACLQEVNAISVTYTAGYGTASSVPQSIKQAIILLVCHWFDNGMCDPPPAVLSLLGMERVTPV
jgi:uncharacterized phiE125 gp8 family phage protein